MGTLVNLFLADGLIARPPLPPNSENVTEQVNDLNTCLLRLESNMGVQMTKLEEENRRIKNEMLNIKEAIKDKEKDMSNIKQDVGELIQKSNKSTTEIFKLQSNVFQQ